MSEAKTYPYLQEEEISRKAIEMKKSNDPNKIGQLTAFLKHGNALVDIIEEHEGPYLRNSTIREKLEPNNNKGDTGRMMNFINKYEVGETWTNKEENTLWISSEFITDKIEKIYEVLDGYNFDY